MSHKTKKKTTERYFQKYECNAHVIVEPDSLNEAAWEGGNALRHIFTEALQTHLDNVTRVELTRFLVNEAEGTCDLTVEAITNDPNIYIGLADDIEEFITSAIRAASINPNSALINRALIVCFFERELSEWAQGTIP